MGCNCSARLSDHQISICKTVMREYCILGESDFGKQLSEIDVIDNAYIKMKLCMQFFYILSQTIRVDFVNMIVVIKKTLSISFLTLNMNFSNLDTLKQ